jgi:uncharacterized protein YutE (UPF0331/DUF86 family)
MTDLDVLIEKTNSIQNCLKRISDTVKGNLNLVDTQDVQDIVVLNLQRAIQLVIDMASHVVATENLGMPLSLKDVFQILEKNKIIPHHLSQKMQKMTGFRNIAVHDYQAIDTSILKSIISNHLKDIEEFYDAVIRRSSTK